MAHPFEQQQRLSELSSRVRTLEAALKHAQERIEAERRRATRSKARRAARGNSRSLLWTDTRSAASDTGGLTEGNG